MNIDTDTPVRVHAEGRIPHVPQLRRGAQPHGEVGGKKAYDPRRGKLAEDGMVKRVAEACENLGRLHRHHSREVITPLRSVPKEGLVSVVLHP
jgi:hypothetical protein